MLELPSLPISATAIRDRARRGLSIRYLTPAPVVQYINEEALYARPGAGVRMV
jgi:nicotinic acid mononucleotide adenylyltransferase